MAVTAFDQGFRIHTDASTLNNATVGIPGGAGAYRVRCTGIRIHAGAAPGATQVRVGGSGGTILYSQTPTANTIHDIPFAAPQWLGDVYASPGTNVEVLVFVE